MSDAINPDYYKAGGVETAPYLHWSGLGNNGFVFNVAKYISRSGKKTLDPRQDLKKAIRYLDFCIEFGLAPNVVRPRCRVGENGLVTQVQYAKAKNLSPTLSHAMFALAEGRWHEARVYVQQELTHVEAHMRHLDNSIARNGGVVRGVVNE